MITRQEGSSPWLGSLGKASNHTRPADLPSDLLRERQPSGPHFNPEALLLLPAARISSEFHIAPHRRIHTFQTI